MLSSDWWFQWSGLRSSRLAEKWITMNHDLPKRQICMACLWISWLNIIISRENLIILWLNLNLSREKNPENFVNKRLYIEKFIKVCVQPGTQQTCSWWPDPPTGTVRSCFCPAHHLPPSLAEWSRECRSSHCPCSRAETSAWTLLLLTSSLTTAKTSTTKRSCVTK